MLDDGGIVVSCSVIFATSLLTARQIIKSNTHCPTGIPNKKAVPISVCPQSKWDKKLDLLRDTFPTSPMIIHAPALG